MAVRGERAVFTRISVQNADGARRELQQFGREGQRALKSIDDATMRPSKGLLALNDNTARVTGGLRQLGNTAAIIDGPLGGVASRFSATATLATRAGIAVGGLTLGVGGLTFGLKRAIEAAEAQNRALFQTEQLLVTTGRASGRTAEQIDTLAVGIGRATLASRQGAREAANQLLTFRSIAGETFDRTLRLAQDLASLGFGSISSASVQLAKALEDPALGLTQLRRIGVSFTADQQELIKALNETGRQAEAQAIILDTLERQVGGAGTAQAGGLAGAYDTLAENVGIFLENVGNVGPVTAAAEAMGGLAAGVEGVNEALFRTPEARAAALLDMLGEVDARLARIETTPGADMPFGMGFGGGLDAMDRENLVRQQTELREELELVNAEFAARARARENAAVMADLAQRGRAEEAARADALKMLDAGLERERKAEEKAAGERTRLRTAAARTLEQIEQRTTRAQLNQAGLLADRFERDAQRLDALRRDRLIGEVDYHDALERLEAEHQAEVTKLARREEVKRGRDRDRAAREEERRLKELERAYERTYEGGAAMAARRYFEEVNTAGARTAEFTQRSFRTIEDSLAEFFETGRVTTAQFFGSIRAGLARLAAQDVVGSIGNVLGIGRGTGSGGTGSGGIISAAISAAGDLVTGIFGFAQGGRIEGPGTGRSDSILARVSRGEFVMNADATARHRPVLEAMNDNRLPRFQSGGIGSLDAAARAGQARAFERTLAEFGVGSREAAESQFRRRQGLPPGQFYGFASETGLRNIFGPGGDVVDRAGGTFLERLGTFFGAGTSGGFLGSRALGAILGVLGALLPGGALLGGAVALGANLLREVATGGAALGTGIAGFAYDVATGRTSIGGTIAGAFAGLDRREPTSTFSVGTGGGSLVSTALATTPRERNLLLLRSSGNALEGYRGSLSDSYRRVENAGDRVLRQLGFGGRFDAGEAVVVGERGQAEVAVFDRPGRIEGGANPVRDVVANDNDMTGLMLELIGEVRALRREVANGNAAAVGARATLAADTYGRTTAAGG